MGCAAPARADAGTDLGVRAAGGARRGSRRRGPVRLARADAPARAERQPSARHRTLARRPPGNRPARGGGSGRPPAGGATGDRGVAARARGPALAGAADRDRLGPGTAALGAARRGGDPGRRHVPPGDRAAARGRDARRTQPERRVCRRAGWARPGHRPRAVRGGARPPAQGTSTRRAARHPGAPHTGRPGRPRGPRDRPL